MDKDDVICFIKYVDNKESLEFHKAIGFEEVNRIICFRKNL